MRVNNLLRILLTVDSPATPLDAYCVADGAKLMEQEAGRVMELSVKKAIHELQLISNDCGESYLY
jgi:hypothetical protein